MPEPCLLAQSMANAVPLISEARDEVNPGVEVLPLQIEGELSEEPPEVSPGATKGALIEVPSVATGGPVVSQMNANTLHNIDYPVGGRIQRFASKWNLASSWLRKVVKDGYRWKFLSKRPPRMKRLPKVRPTNPEVCSLLNEYKEKGAIERCSHPLWVSNVRSIPKTSGGHRLIVNLRSLNNHIKKRCYKLPTIKNLRLALNQGDWLAKISTGLMHNYYDTIIIII